MVYRLVGSLDGKRLSVDLRPGPNRLGRSSKDAELLVPRDTVSRFHAQIDVGESGLEIHDCQSHNGTYVNGQRIQHAVLRLNDAIRLGDVELHLVEASDAEPTGASKPGHGTESLSGRPGHSAPTFRADSQLDSVRLIWTKTPAVTDSLVNRSFTRVPAGTDSLDDGADMLEALVDLGSFLVRDEPGRDIAAVCLEHVAHIFHSRLACLLEVNQSSGVTEVIAHHPANLEPELEVSRTMVDIVLRERQTLLLNEVTPEISATAHKKGIRSAVVTPLMQDDEVLGVLYVDHQNRMEHYDVRHQRRLQLLANLMAAKIASTRTRNEIEWAAMIQSKFLPETLVHPEGYAVAARLLPSELVGGDLYETLKLPDGRFLYVLGDVVGHGVGAALMMSNALATLRALANGAESALGLATQMHELLLAQLPTECYITMFLGLLDPRTHVLDYVTAGHPPPLLLGPEGEVESLASTALAIAMPIPMPIRSDRKVLSRGSLLAIWSDGIPEAIRLGVRPMQDFTEARLTARLKELRRQPLEDILECIFRETDEFIGGPKAQDDRTMVLLRREI